MTKLHSIKDFCAAVGISPPTFHRLVKAGQGPAQTKIGRRVFVSDADGQAWIDARRRASSQREAA